MFDFLKKKISQIVDGFSKKVEKKEKEQEKKVEELEKAIEKKVEKIEPDSFAEPAKAIETIKEVIEAKLPEKKEQVEEAVEEIKEEISHEKPKEEMEKAEEPAVKPETKIEERVNETPQKSETKKTDEKKSWIKKLSEKIVKSIVEKKLGEEDVAPLFTELETDLLESDVALEVVEKIKSDLRSSLLEKEIQKGKEKQYIKDSIRQSLLGILSVPKVELKEMVKSKKPVVLLFLGFNGNGKTSVIAKVAKHLKDSGYSCVISASDCFRAAAIDQIEEHAKKIGVKLVKHQYGADPAAVAFDAISHAKANNIDFVLIDTAGRTHTNVNLMKEMEKIVRVSKPDLKVLVVDSLIGNDVVPQARTFNDTIGIDAVIFTKVDINPKGGSLLSVSYLLKKPILFLSVGQDYPDLKEFERDWFVGQLMGNG